jgi:diaminopimelate epimerase
LLTEAAGLVADEVKEVAAGTDGLLQVLARGEDWLEVVIWNPDGSIAELSGNGTRIAAAWLAAETGAELVQVSVGPRTVVARRLPDGSIEQELGDVEVAAPETVDGIELTRVTVGNPHAVVRGDPDEIERLGPMLETHPSFPNRTNVQVVRVDGTGEVTARVWERGVGETASSGTSAVAVAAATHGEGEVIVHFPGGDLRVRLQHGRASLIGSARRVD